MRSGVVGTRHGPSSPSPQELDAELSHASHLDARRVALELKAKRLDLANEIIHQTLGQGPESASFRLALVIEARRFELVSADVTRIDAEWAAELTKKVRGDSAGALASLLSSFLALKISYRDRDKHVQQVVDYLARTTRIKYEFPDLNAVCLFLARGSTSATST